MAIASRSAKKYWKVAYPVAKTRMNAVIHQLLPASQPASRPIAPSSRMKEARMNQVLRLLRAMALYTDYFRSELHARRLADRGAVDDLEELPLVEAEVAGEQVVREHLDLGVQLPNAAVVEAAGGLDLVFGVDDRLLQLEEVLARLQLRIGLRDSEQRLQRLLHVALCDARFGRAARCQRLGSGACDVFEDRLLMGRIALHRLDQVRQQIGSTLQLDGDVAPRLVDAHIERDQRVVCRPQVDADDDDERHDDQYRDQPFPHARDSVRG